jgi:ketosteroid isomerase-like protein
MDEKKHTEEIIETIRAMNRCWTETWNEGEFRQHIHPDAVAIVPTIPGLLAGRDAYVAGWRGFAEHTRIIAWDESDHRVRLYAADLCAVVTYLFSIRFETGGQVQEMQGRDMFFLTRLEGRWLVVADQFSPEPGLTPETGCNQ